MILPQAQDSIVQQHKKESIEWGWQADEVYYINVILIILKMIIPFNQMEKIN